MRQGSESGEMHDYSFGLTAFALWRVGVALLVPLPVVRRVSAIGYDEQERNLIWLGWRGSQMNLYAHSFFFRCLFFVNPPLVEQVKRDVKNVNTQLMCQHMHAFSRTNVTDTLVYLGCTVYGGNKHDDRRNRDDRTDTGNVTECVEHVCVRLKLKVGPMNLWSISYQLVMPLPTFNMSEQSTSLPVLSLSHTHTAHARTHAHTPSWCINVLTSPPPVSRENKRARDSKRWRDGCLGGWCSCRSWGGGCCAVDWEEMCVIRSGGLRRPGFYCYEVKIMRRAV